MHEELGPSLRARRGRIRSGSAALILAAYCQALGVIPPSYSKLTDMILFQGDANLNMDANLSWFMGHSGICPSSNSPYTRAYLRSYYEIGEGYFCTYGILLTGRQYMIPDRAVMKSLLTDNYVEILDPRRPRIKIDGQYVEKFLAFSPPSFEITELGRALISDVPSIDENAPFGF
jgi:hypothetical protein